MRGSYSKRMLRAILPGSTFEFLRRIKRARLRGSAKVSYGNDPQNHCPICGKSDYFISLGIPIRPKAQCPRCGSLERHRLLWLFFRDRTDMFRRVDLKILHVAAEPCFESRFRKLYGKKYLTADLDDPGAMVKMDVTDIRYPDETFDIVICNHVLEHVADDIKAMREIYRVLKTGGWAIPLVPMSGADKTYEDNSITDGAGRREAFGQDDHVRSYGKDYADRLTSVGFNVKIVRASELTDGDGIKNMRLPVDDEDIYYCEKL